MLQSPLYRSPNFISSGVPRIDWSNPITNQLKAVYMPGYYHFNLVTGSALIFHGGLSAQSAFAGTYGGSWGKTAVTGQNGWQTTDPLFLVNSGGTWSIFGLSISATSSSTTGGPFYCERGSAGNDILKLCMNSGNSGQGDMVIRNDGGTLLQLFTNTTGLFDGKYHSYVGTKNSNGGSGNVIIYLDGTQDVTGNWTGADTYTDSNVGGVMLDLQDASNATMAVVITAVWSRVLTPIEARMLASDPFNFLIFPEDDVMRTLTGTRPPAVAVFRRTLSGMGTRVGTRQVHAPWNFSQDSFGTAFPRNFFISAAGNDSNTGMSSSLPWLTVGKVNANTMLPGDTYSFRGGDTFTDATLIPSASGTAARPITFNSYGVGQATIAPPSAHSGFKATNLSNVNISNLTFTGTAGTNQPGVWFSYLVGAQTGLSLTGLTVTGFPSDGIRVLANGSATSTITNVTISNCVCTGNCLVDNGNQGTAGIHVSGLYGANGVNGAYTIINAIIQNCYTANNPGVAGAGNWTGSGIFLSECSGGLITGCVSANNGSTSLTPIGTVGIWTADAKNVIIQYCESYGTKSAVGVSDGDGFDMDGGSTNCITQYCYSHNNLGHGFAIQAFDDPGNVVTTSNCTVRFCVSENDALNSSPTQQGGIFVAADGSQATCVNNLVHNNVFYTKTATVNDACCVFSSNGAATSCTFTNNIFYSGGNNCLLIWNGSLANTNMVFAGNCYFSTGTFNMVYGGTNYGSLLAFRATGQEMIGAVLTGFQTNPTLVNAGGGGTMNSGSFVTQAMFAAFTAYKLAHGTTMFKAGLNTTTQFSTNPGALDFNINNITAGTLSVGANCPGSAP